MERQSWALLTMQLAKLNNSLCLHCICHALSLTIIIVMINGHIYGGIVTHIAVTVYPTFAIPVRVQFGDPNLHPLDTVG